jgi:hypothetical protein
MPDAQLVRNVQYCAFDTVLGRGTTEAIVNTFFHAENDRRSAAQKTRDCAKGALRVGKGLVWDLPKSLINSTVHVARDAVACVKRGAGQCLRETRGTVAAAASKAFTSVRNGAVSAARGAEAAARNMWRCSNPWRDDATRRQLQ